MISKTNRIPELDVIDAHNNEILLAKLINAVYLNFNSIFADLEKIKLPVVMLQKTKYI